VSSDFELEDIEKLHSTENSQTARQPQPVKELQTSKSGWDTQTTSMLGSQIEDYCASSYPKSTGSSHPLSLDDMSTFQLSNYEDEPVEKIAMAGKDLHYPALLPRMLVFPVSRPPVLELSPSDVRAAQALAFM